MRNLLQGVKVSWWDVFELPEESFGFDRRNPDRSMKKVENRWCISTGDLFHLSASARQDFSSGIARGVIVKMVCGQHLVQPGVVKDANAPVSLSLAKLMTHERQTRICDKCGNRYPELTKPIYEFLTRMRRQVAEDQSVVEQQRFGIQQQEKMRVSMDMLIEKGIIESLDTPLSDLNLDGLTLRDLVELLESTAKPYNNPFRFHGLSNIHVVTEV